MISLTHSRTVRCAVVVAVGVAAAACGGGHDARSASSGGRGALACRANLDDAVGLAVTHYVKAAKPKPQRFLIAAGTDSALGDAGLTALQDKGPTYLFPGDPALQKQVLEQLKEKGDYTTLLVVRKAADAKSGSASVSLAGHYIGGDDQGKEAGPRSYRFACDTAGWHLKDSTAEHSA